MHAFTVGAYRPYFDVDTSDVLERIKDSLVPFKGSFTEKTSDNPDLYAFHLLQIYAFISSSRGRSRFCLDGYYHSSNAVVDYIQTMFAYLLNLQHNVV